MNSFWIQSADLKHFLSKLVTQDLLREGANILTYINELLLYIKATRWRSTRTLYLNHIASNTKYESKQIHFFFWEPISTSQLKKQNDMPFVPLFD